MVFIGRCRFWVPAVISSFFDILLMLVIFYATLSAGQYNRRYDVLHAKWGQRGIYNREALRNFFSDFNLEPTQAASWLRDGTSAATVACWVKGGGQLSGDELAKISIIRAARLSQGPIGSDQVPLFLAPTFTPIACVLKKAIREPRQFAFQALHVTQDEIASMTRQFETNAKTAASPARASRALRSKTQTARTDL
jgi:hypothetical protein